MMLGSVPGGKVEGKRAAKGLLPCGGLGFVLRWLGARRGSAVWRAVWSSGLCCSICSSGLRCSICSCSGLWCGSIWI
uniref:Uncharacterized protein n=1 Tax=Salix viminalis TaxID=40686 RepID=A0A6N2K2Q9_SALVM